MGHLANDAFDKFRYQFNSFVAERLQFLLENKHLYQKLSIEPLDLLAVLRKGVSSLVGEREGLDSFVNHFLDGRFTISDKILFREPGHIPQLCLRVSNVKLFCATCDTREAFRPILFSDVTSDLLGENIEKRKNTGRETFKIAFGNSFQLFILAYQCQHCEGIPEIFLIKRDELNLTIEGRSPIEHIEIPKYIPEDERRWFRDAIIAFQTGKVLAALFYLRTFIEQFARRKTKMKDEKKTGDEILSAYAETIPANLRDSIPSLAEWYDKLSDALHSAREDVELFELARKRVEKHFDVRRVHELY